MSTGNLRFLYDNFVDKATVTANTEASATLGAINLKNTLKKKVWRSTGLTSEWNKFDFGQPEYFNAIALVEFNLTIDGTIRLMASNVSDFSVLLLDQTIDAWEPLYGAGMIGAGLDGAGGYLTNEERQGFTSLSIVYFSSWINAQYVKFEYSDSGNSDGYIELGRPFIGPYFEVEYNFQKNFQIEQHDPSTVKRSLGGQKYTNIQETYRIINIDFQRISNAEKYFEYFKLMRNYGVKKDIIISLTPEQEPDFFFHTIYGRLQKTFPIQGITENKNKAVMTIEESL